MVFWGRTAGKFSTKNKWGRDIRTGPVGQPVRYSPNTLPNVTSVHLALALEGFLSHDLIKHPLRPWYPLSISCIPRQRVPQATTAWEGFSSLFFSPDFFLYLASDGFWLHASPTHPKKEAGMDFCLSSSRLRAV